MSNLQLLSGVTRHRVNPNRDQIIHVQGNLCNLRDAEDMPIFDAFIDYLIINEPSRAEDWAARLVGNGASHCNIDLSGDYAENLGWAPRYPIPGTDWTSDIDTFRRILDWLLDRTLIPIIHLAADGQGFDPVGMTYGWQWGMNVLPTLGKLLNDYKAECLWNPGYDGCFPNWSPDQLCQFLTAMRQVFGEGAQIATEFGAPDGASISYCHLGNGAADWTRPGMIELDAFFIELQTNPAQEDGIAETATRLLGPNAKNTATSPYYLSQPRPRGECAIIDYENVAYWYIRKQLSQGAVAAAANACRKYGFTYFGNGQPS